MLCMHMSHIYSCDALCQECILRELNLCLRYIVVKRIGTPSIYCSSQVMKGCLCKGVWQYSSLESKTFIFQQHWNLRRAWLPGRTCHGSWLVLLGSAPWPSVAFLLTRTTFTNVFVLPWLWALLNWGAGGGAGRFGVLLCTGLFPLPCSCRGLGLGQTGWLSLDSVQLLPSLGSRLPGLWPGWVTCPWVGGIALWGSCCQGGFLPSCPASDGPQAGDVPCGLSFILGCIFFLIWTFK